MFYRIKKVRPMQGYNLLVDFVTGERKQYDVNPLFSKWEPFRALIHSQGLFERVKVDAGGYGISWNADIDLSCNELYENGTSTQP